MATNLPLRPTCLSVTYQCDIVGGPSAEIMDQLIENLRRNESGHLLELEVTGWQGRSQEIYTTPLKGIRVGSNNDEYIIWVDGRDDRFVVFYAPNQSYKGFVKATHVKPPR